ncbi:MAG TPA: hypothetical protein VE732_01965, partial [Nitrososphaera sp.]|nr:hypothetical protein [Nitrososphaera sp.]
MDPIIDVFDRTVEETLEQKLDNLLNVFEASPIDLTNLEQIGQKPSRELIVPAGRSLIILNNRITQIFRQNPELLRTIDPFTFER